MKEKHGESCKFNKEHTMKFSILIPTLESRKEMFSRLKISLDSQLVGNLLNEVEILYLLDNRQKTIGEKRNILLNSAKGDFLTFIDDDDRVSDNYIKKIIEAITCSPDSDCIVFDCICTITSVDKHIKSGRKQYCKYGIEFDYTKQDPWTESNIAERTEMEQWRGKPSHTMVWKSLLAKNVMFPNQNVGEDFDWVKRMWPKIKKQIRINEVLYYYDAVLDKRY